MRASRELLRSNHEKIAGQKVMRYIYDETLEVYNNVTSWKQNKADEDNN